MSREIAASAVLAPNQYPLLLLHRHIPERTLPDLLAASARVNDPVRLALFHLQSCDVCAPACLVNAGVLCLRGVPLVAGCAGWRARA
jgi:hypothetical protein